jgi:hypothetical protein
VVDGDVRYCCGSTPDLLVLRSLLLAAFLFCTLVSILGQPRAMSMTQN